MTDFSAPRAAGLAVAGICAVALASGLTAATPAWAQDKVQRLFANPPPILKGTDLANETLLAPGQALPSNGEVSLDLYVRYIDNTIYNPATGRDDKVRLRGYQGTDTDPDAPYIAPIIDVAPGQTVRVTLHNELPTDSSCLNHGGGVNIPHCFNGTNLHTHGWWVNPSGNSDNVLISIDPGVSFQYEYNLPPDHPAGTFWYHPHRHGSTALQVSSGMVGALIVRGDRLPTPTENGDLDVLLESFQERVLVLQQIAYACYDFEQPPEDGAYPIKKDKDGAKFTNQVQHWYIPELQWESSTVSSILMIG